nr:hyccin [Quercus suber]POE64563.1 hyccin [Quercus suber]
MSDHSEPTTPSSTLTPTSEHVHSTSLDSLSKTKSAIESLSSILSSFPSNLSFSISSSNPNPAFSLLHDPQVASQVSYLLREPNSGAGDNNLCRWLYDTFQSGDPNLQLIVLRFLPIIVGIYLSRVALRKPLAGFEAVLLALYAHETTSRAGQPITMNVPNLSLPSVYHEAKAPINNDSTELNLAVISPSLEPHGTVRSTRRARIVGVALELYHSKIYHMPVGSKIDFCDFCVVWAGQDNNDDDRDLKKESESNGRKEGRIPLPWELLQPVLRILGHCLMGNTKNKELFDAAWAACNSLYARSMHDIDPKALLATGSLLKLGKKAMEPSEDLDPTEIRRSNVLVI